MSYKFLLCHSCLLVCSCLASQATAVCAFFCVPALLLLEQILGSSCVFMSSFSFLMNGVLSLEQAVQQGQTDVVNEVVGAMHMLSVTDYGAEKLRAEQVFQRLFLPASLQNLVPSLFLFLLECFWSVQLSLRVLLAHQFLCDVLGFQSAASAGRSGCNGSVLLCPHHALRQHLGRPASHCLVLKDRRGSHYLELIMWN